MSEIILDDNQIEVTLKKIKLRRNISVLIFISCSIFGVIFLFTSLSSVQESELLVAIVFVISFVIIITGVFNLYLIGLVCRRLVFYYNLISPLQFNHININTKYLLSRKNQILLMYSGFANGLYYILIENNMDLSSKNKDPKKIPSFLIRLNKKINLGNKNIRCGEFSGFFKIPQGSGEFVEKFAKVVFMPLATFSKSQGKAEYIHKMIEYMEKQSI